ncbi:hypothetical protein MBLNU230_g0065t1 [Neophaeotheca triangularis]
MANFDHTGVKRASQRDDTSFNGGSSQPTDPRQNRLELATKLHPYPNKATQQTPRNAGNEFQSKQTRNARQKEFHTVSLTTPNYMVAKHLPPQEPTLSSDWQEISPEDAPYSSYNSHADHKWKYDETYAREAGSEQWREEVKASEGKGYVADVKTAAAWGWGRASAGVDALWRKGSKSMDGRVPES